VTHSNLPPNGGVKEIFTLTQGSPALTARLFYPIFDRSLKIQSALLSRLNLPY
jgi:hypothetical protein